MATKAEQKRLDKPIKLKIRRGDKVMIIAGKDKGEVGHVHAVSPKESKVIVLKDDPENAGGFIPLNAATKHRKARFQNERSARVRIPVPIHVSNVMVIDPTTDKPTKIARKKEDGKTVRVSKATGAVIPDQAMDWGKQ